MGELTSYGGDVRVVASRRELERIGHELGSIQSSIHGEMNLFAQLHGVVNHLQLDAHIPEMMVRLGLQRLGCFTASESYFSAETRIAHEIGLVQSFVSHHPWLMTVIPHGTAISVGLGMLAGAFSNTNSSSWLTRIESGLLPLAKAGALAGRIPDSAVQLIEQVPNAVNMQHTLSGLTSRLNNKSGHIRIESYTAQGHRLVVLYLPGTGSLEKSFDARSDLQLMAHDQRSNSYRSTVTALEQFGMESNDKLLVVGYSQGGMVGAELIENNFPVAGLVTIGSPVAKSAIPESIPVLSIEHSNDIVPAVTGETNPFSENWVTASRHFDLKPGQTVIDAHWMEGYQETAALADESKDQGLLRIKNLILSQFDGTKIQRIVEYLPLRGALVP